jgi:hypothetical protein
MSRDELLLDLLELCLPELCSLPQLKLLRLLIELVAEILLPYFLNLLVLICLKLIFGLLLRSLPFLFEGHYSFLPLLAFLLLSLADLFLILLMLCLCGPPNCEISLNKSLLKIISLRYRAIVMF